MGLGLKLRTLKGKPAPPPAPPSPATYLHHGAVRLDKQRVQVLDLLRRRLLVPGTLEAIHHGQRLRVRDAYTDVDRNLDDLFGRLLRQLLDARPALGCRGLGLGYVPPHMLCVH